MGSPTPTQIRSPVNRSICPPSTDLLPVLTAPTNVLNVTPHPPPKQQIRAAHILCADEEAAEAALTRIKAGEQFGDVAADMSSCPSKDKGGDLGWFKKGQMVAEFEAACFENDPGTIVKVQTQFGWHVVRERAEFWC